MPEYEPLPLGALCNAGVELYGPDRFRSGGTYLQVRPELPPLGEQSFHGLPFLIGPAAQPDGERCFLAFGCDNESYRATVRIPVGKSARHVLFAHAVLETELWRGGELGIEVALYRFCFADGSVVEVPIRERFEIGTFPLPWGQYPFLCLPDQKDALEDRYQGRWSHSGFRQTEVTGAVPHGYFIWSWHNPCPTETLTAIEVVPRAGKFVLAAVTLGHIDETPVLRDTARPVQVTLRDAEDAARPFDLTVDVDRGTASYAYPLPTEPLDVAAPEMRGFGAPPNRSSSPAYTTIAALPSATVSVTQSGESLAEFRWADLAGAGSLETPRVRFDLLEHAKNWVRVSVLDADTGEALPCRIAFHSPAGVPYPPHGHHAPIFSNQPTWNIDIGGDVSLG
ncbi:MAG: hypothetical protein WD314_16090, partial [Trueperaceae bacterium]